MDTKDFFKDYQTERQRANMATEILKHWLAATPTDESGNYCPINQPQAFAASEFLKKHTRTNAERATEDK
jgi:hypothetical protein